MKIIVSALAIGLSVLNCSAQSFENSFRSAFTQSIRGLVPEEEAQHTTVAVNSIPVEEMELTEIVFLPEYGRHALRISKRVENEATGQAFVGRFRSRIENTLPDGDYRSSEVSSMKYSDKSCKTFSPVKNNSKNQPEIEVGTVYKNDHYEFQILLIEPEQKNSYTPKF